MATQPRQKKSAMAQTAEVAFRVERDLDALHSFTADLAGLVEEWESLSENAKEVESLDWDHLVGSYLTELAEYYLAGQMTPKQQARYRELLKKLKESMPAIRKLNLRLPPISVGV